MEKLLQVDTNCLCHDLWFECGPHAGALCILTHLKKHNIIINLQTNMNYAMVSNVTVNNDTIIIIYYTMLLYNNNIIIITIYRAL